MVLRFRDSVVACTAEPQNRPMQTLEPDLVSRLRRILLAPHDRQEDRRRRYEGQVQRWVAQCLEGEDEIRAAIAREYGAEAGELRRAKRAFLRVAAVERAARRAHEHFVAGGDTQARRREAGDDPAVRPGQQALISRLEQ